MFSLLSSRGIEPLTVINQFFYREPPLPIGSPTLVLIFNFIDKQLWCCFKPRNKPASTAVVPWGCDIKGLKIVLFLVPVSDHKVLNLT